MSRTTTIIHYALCFLRRVVFTFDTKTPGNAILDLCKVYYTVGITLLKHCTYRGYAPAIMVHTGSLQTAAISESKVDVSLHLFRSATLYLAVSEK